MGSFFSAPYQEPVTIPIPTATSIPQEWELSDRAKGYVPANEDELCDVINEIGESGSGHVVVQAEGANHLDFIKEGSVPVCLSKLKGIQPNYRRTELKIGASATVENVIEYLNENDLFLPLSNCSSDTILDALSSQIPGYFDNSVAPLHACVSKLDVLTTSSGGSAKIESVTPGDESQNLSRVLDPLCEDYILISATFQVYPASKLSDLWLIRSVSPFDFEVLRNCAKSALLLKDQNVDLVVETARAYGGLPMICFTMCGRGGDIENPGHISQKCLRDMHSSDDLSSFKFPIRSADGPSASLIASSSSAVIGLRTPGKRVITASKSVDEGDLVCLKEMFEHASDCPRISLEFRAARDSARGDANRSSIEVSTRLLIPETLRRGKEEKARELFTNFFPEANETETPSRAEILENFNMLASRETQTSVRSALRDLAFGSNDSIEGFRGEIYWPNDAGYKEKATVYASSSYNARMSQPFLVAYPEDVNDIILAVRFAMSKGKKVVARSGGHQYCCLSSGDSSVVLLSMDRFSYVLGSSQDPSGNEHVLRVGVATPLTRLSSKMTDLKLSIPHGECPLVAVGGHTQTGGYGHTLRSFGLLVDYVRSFWIVLASGQYVCIYRPDVEVKKYQNNDEIFRAVLGGGPGSFGVVTEYTYEAVKDSDHTFSTGLGASYVYTKKRWHEMMHVVQEWSKNERNFPGDSDIMCTAMSLGWHNFWPGWMHDKGEIHKKPPSDTHYPRSGPVLAGPGPSESEETDRCLREGVLLLELLHGDNQNGGEKARTMPERKAARLDASTRFTNYHNRIIKNEDRLRERWSYRVLIDPKEEESHSLSYMCDSWVRNYGTTRGGREFVLPYEKRLNATFEPLSDEFVTKFIDIVHECILDTEHVRVVFQMTLGGGKHRNHEHRKFTALQRRDINIGIVFDVFYLNGHQDVARGYQNRMKRILEDTVTEKDSVRQIWGSFGNTNMREVSSYYYDNKEVYEALQGIKSDVDPTDVFHTAFTVQLPS